jgi:beta-glucosidase
LKARFKLGMFDPPELVPFTSIPYEVINSQEHRKIALQTARESIVLLKNENNLLPLDKDIKSIAIIGPNANDPEALYYTHYYPEAPEIITILDAMEHKCGSDIEISYAEGCKLTEPADDLSEALKIAKQADIIIGAFGLNSTLEGEEGYVFNEMMGDRENLRIPEAQEQLIEKLHQTGTPMVLLLTSGSALSVNFAKNNIPAIVHVWYPGCEGGNAIADILFGNYNPSGRLPITFYKSVDQLPDYHDYNMENRTYRYFKEDPLFPFGHGLSYSEFEYSNLSLSTNEMQEGKKVRFTLDISNLGPYPGEEVVQVYLSRRDLQYRVPIHELKAIKKVFIQEGQQKTLEFTLTSDQFKTVNNKGVSILEPGVADIYVGSGQPTFEQENILSEEIKINT